ncbi:MULTISPECIES: restriction endonuclease subunit S [Bacteroides]|jgi:type I restriction enzyme S subunit|uniref:restriction endonuclease subunit S n=1 Tax=Bacteroides TaxID=816 RepID=UPI0022DEF474|nr:restriction endonuclease subunit S [Bacteroides xylanisolvens]
MEEYKLSDIAEVRTGPFGSQLHNEDYVSTGTPIVTVEHLGNRRFSKQNLPLVSDDDKKRLSKYLLQEGDIVFSRVGSVDRCSYVTSAENDWLFSGRCLRVRCGNNCHPLFLYYYFCKESVKQYIKSIAVGATMPSINTKLMAEIPILLPKLEEQRCIADILSSFDDKIELNRRINDNLEQQAQALFKAWFVDFEPFRDGEFVNSVLGSTPKELPITYIENIPHNIESGKRPKGGATLIGVPSIGAENIKGLGYYDYSKTKYIPEEYAQTIKKGKINGYELLIYKDGGKPGYFIPNFTIFGEGFPFNEMYINEHVFLLDLMDCGYNVFAYFYMQTPYIMNQLNSIGGKAAIPGINTKDVECLPIYSNESPYVKKFGEIVLPFIKTILSNSLENAKQAKVRDTLLPKLMSGELKINEIETEK